MSTVPIPLSKLHLSEHNVRHPVDGDPANDVHDLQASILAQGLMNPLQVHPLKKPRGHYAVHAGGRRLRALQGLETDGRLPDHLREPDCYVSAAPPSDLAEASLAENLVRVALKPTAEFEAFATLAGGGMEEEEIARRYAVTVLHVRQRMRLGRLHPTVMAALDEARITLDLAKAYAATEDQTLQARVFEEMGGGHGHTARNVRNAIRGGAGAQGADRMLEVVGVDAYVAAGGALEEDLFEGGFRVLHVGTLTDLYYPKLEQLHADLKATLRDDIEVVSDHARTGRYVHVVADPTPEQIARLGEIDERSAAIDDEVEPLLDDSGMDIAADAADQPRIDALVAEQQRLSDESDAIHEAAETKLPDGPLLAVTALRGGRLAVQGFYRPEGWTDPDAAEAGDGGTRTGGAAPAASLNEPIGLDPRIGYGDPKAAVKAEHGLTADATEAMRNHRRAILRGMMVKADGGTWTVAALLLPFMALRNLLGGSGREYGMRGDTHAKLGVAQGAFTTSHGPVIGLAAPDEFSGQPCATRWSDTLAYLEDEDWLTEPDLRKAFALFTAAPPRQQELAGAVAAGLLLDRSLDAPGYRVPLHDELALLMGQSAREEVRRQWTPDAAFFARLPKSRRIAAVESVAPGVAKEIGKLPTADIAAACALFFSGSDEARKRWRLQPGMIALAKRWVPDFLAFEPDQGIARIVDVMDAERDGVAA